MPGHRPGVPGTPGHPGGFQKIYVIVSYVPFLLPINARFGRRKQFFFEILIWVNVPCEPPYQLQQLTALSSGENLPKKNSGQLIPVRNCLFKPETNYLGVHEQWHFYTNKAKNSGAARGPGSLGGPGWWYSYAQTAHSSRKSRPGTPSRAGTPCGLAPCPFPKRCRRRGGGPGRKGGMGYWLVVFFALYGVKKRGNIKSWVPNETGPLVFSKIEDAPRLSETVQNVSTSDFQSEVGEVFGEIGGELPAKFGRRFSSFFCWGKSSEAFSTKNSTTNFTIKLHYAVLGCGGP